MAPGEGKIGFAVVKTQGVESPHHTCGFGNGGFGRVKALPVGSIDLPSIRRMAGSAIELQGCAVRVLRP